MLVGHIEGGAIVRYDHGGSVIKRYDFATLRVAAANAGANLFVLGCHSADFLDEGVTSAFNTVDAINQIASALSASTALEFWGSLASPAMPLVINKEMVTMAKDGSTQTQIDGSIIAADDGTEVASTLVSYSTSPSPTAVPGPGGGETPGCVSVFFITVSVLLGLAAIIWAIRRLNN